MDLPEGWTTDAVRANGVDLQCYRVGGPDDGTAGGPPVVMAHGFYENGRCWAPLADDLADEHEVVTYDARGHGRSDAPESGYGMDDRVADLVGLVDALDLEDPILVGHSMGGATVAWTAATHPELPRAAVLEEPAGMLGEPPMGPDERVRVVRDRLDDWAERSVEDIAGDYGDWDPELARRVAVANTECSPHIAAIARDGYPPAVEAFPDITCPTLVLAGDADPEERGRELDAADRLPDGRMVHVPGAGHHVFRDRYDAACRELRTFLWRLD